MADAGGETGGRRSEGGVAVWEGVGCGDGMWREGVRFGMMGGGCC